MEPQLPPGWGTKTSRSSGVTYYVNTVTGETTYDLPTQPALGAPTEPPASATTPARSVAARPKKRPQKKAGKQSGKFCGAPPAKPPHVAEAAAAAEAPSATAEAARAAPQPAALAQLRGELSSGTNSMLGSMASMASLASLDLGDGGDNLGPAASFAAALPVGWLEAPSDDGLEMRWMNALSGEVTSTFPTQAVYDEFELDDMESMDEMDGFGPELSEAEESAAAAVAQEMLGTQTQAQAGLTVVVPEPEPEPVAQESEPEPEPVAKEGSFVSWEAGRSKKGPGAAAGAARPRALFRGGAQRSNSSGRSSSCGGQRSPARAAATPPSPRSPKRSGASPRSSTGGSSPRRRSPRQTAAARTSVARLSPPRGANGVVRRARTPTRGEGFRAAPQASLSLSGKGDIFVTHPASKSVGGDAGGFDPSDRESIYTEYDPVKDKYLPAKTRHKIAQRLADAERLVKDEDGVDRMLVETEDEDENEDEGENASMRVSSVATVTATPMRSPPGLVRAVASPPSEFEQVLDSVFALMDTHKLRTVDLLHSLDRDSGGTVDATELKEAFAHHGVQLRDVDVTGLMSALDHDGDGEIDPREFMEQMRKLKASRRGTNRGMTVPVPADLITEVNNCGVPAEKLRQARSKLRAHSYGQSGQDPRRLYRHFDRDNSGQLEFAEFKAAVRKLGRISAREISDEYLRRLFDSLGQDRTGKVGVEELTAFVWGAFEFVEEATPSGGAASSPRASAAAGGVDVAAVGNRQADALAVGYLALSSAARARFRVQSGL